MGNQIRAKEIILGVSSVDSIANQSDLGCALGTSMRSLSILKKKGVLREQSGLFKTSETVWQNVNSKTWVFMDTTLLGVTNNSTHTQFGRDLTELVRAYLGPSYSRSKNPTLNNPLLRPLTDFIVLRPALIRNRIVGRKFFRFEAAWLQEDECETMVTETWRLNSSSQSATTLRDKILAGG
ncbi:UNVERIFIED_CONTAM: hypothetical protein Sangu_0823000 [Sesamum angustifolium]|uniref:Uncharacterized protein n=1 Tax=Sesamum angustifolium TaxID=2727405 RepID=A0AAW2PWF8_9LAMI